jgi:membrane associated rhomboid family serine protease
MFPVGDDNRDRRTTPVVNYMLILINVIVFVFLQGLGSNESFTMAFSTVPEEIVTGHDVVTEGGVVRDPGTGETVQVPGLGPTPLSVYLTLLTSMFMHGSIAHIAGNMLYLWIFGDNIEDRLGHARYLAFYLVSGVLASLAHVAGAAFGGGDMLVPSLGASGAIAGVLGGYLVFFPGRRVRVIFINMIQEVPALIVIGLWFVFQLVLGLGTFGSKGGGVAYGAHIGGFVAGVLLVRLFALGRPGPVTVRQ